MNPAPTTPLAAVVEALKDAYANGGIALTVGKLDCNGYAERHAPALVAKLFPPPPLCAKCGRESSVHDDNDPDRECDKYMPTVADGLLRAVQKARGGLAPRMPGEMPRPIPTAPGPVGAEAMPAVLFDSNAVYAEVDQRKTSPENVCDVLDAVVRIMKREQPR